MCSNTVMKERELHRKKGEVKRAHLLVVTFFTRWQQHLGTREKGVHRQTQLLLADMVVVCVRPFLHRGRKRKVVREQCWFLLFFYVENKHFGLDPAPYKIKHKPHGLQEASEVTGIFQASPRLQLSLRDCRYQKNVCKSCWNMFHEIKDKLAGTGLWLENKKMGKKAEEKQEHY